MISCTFGAAPRETGPLWRKLESRHEEKQLSAEEARRRERFREVRRLLRWHRDCPPLPAIAGYREIITEVALLHGVTFEEMAGPKRLSRFVRARDEVWWRLKTERGMSYGAIGRRFGGRNHTTILLGVRRHLGVVRKRSAA